MYTKVKQGDTFRLQSVYEDGSPPVPRSLTVAGATPRSQVRKPDGALVLELAISIADQAVSPGQFELHATAAETGVWPAGLLLCDIQYTFANGDVVSSDTFSITVLPDITY